MTTAQDVFDTAMGLIDEVNETTGQTDTTDTREYKNRTLFILNTLRGELYPFSDTYKQAKPGKRPIASRIDSFTSPIGLDDYICQSVLPWGLAALLLLDENPSSANFFQQKYDELKRGLEGGFPTEAEDIEDVYSEVFDYNDFGRWI